MRFKCNGLKYMRIVYLNYFYSRKYDNPEDWLATMQSVNVVLEQLAKKHSIISVQQINYAGALTKNAVHYGFVDFYQKATFFPFRLNLFVKKLKADVIIIHGTVFPLQTILLRLLVGKRITIVIRHHAEQLFRGIKKIVQKIACKIVNAYFFPSTIISNQWQQNGNISISKPIFKIHEGASSFQKIDKPMARLCTKLSGHPIYIWVGRLDTNKHPLLTIKAFERFLQVQPTAKLYMLFYRDELLEEVTNYLLENLLTTNIIVIGKIAYQEMPNWYSSADFYISSSFKEGTSFSLSEAMSCGCIPIVTNIPTHADMLGDSSGFLYETGNENALFEALATSLHLSIEVESLKALQQYQNHLSPNRIANNIVSALAELV